MRISNEYERGAGRQIGDGMYTASSPDEAVHQETKFEILGDLSDVDGDACQWTLVPPDASQTTRLQGVEARHTLEKVGPLHADAAGDRRATAERRAR